MFFSHFFVSITFFGIVLERLPLPTRPLDTCVYASRAHRMDDVGKQYRISHNNCPKCTSIMANHFKCLQRRFANETVSCEKRGEYGADAPTMVDDKTCFHNILISCDFNPISYFYSLNFSCVRVRPGRPTCPSTLFQAWETFLQEIEADSVTANDIAKTMSRQVIYSSTSYSYSE